MEKEKRIRNRKKTVKRIVKRNYRGKGNKKAKNGQGKARKRKLIGKNKLENPCITRNTRKKKILKEEN